MRPGEDAGPWCFTPAKRIRHRAGRPKVVGFGLLCCRTGAKTSWLIELPNQATSDGRTRAGGQTVDPVAVVRYDEVNRERAEVDRVGDDIRVCGPLLVGDGPGAVVIHNGIRSTFGGDEDWRESAADIGCGVALPVPGAIADNPADGGIRNGGT